MAGAPRAQFRKLAHSAVSHMPQMPTETCSLVEGFIFGYVRHTNICVGAMPIILFITIIAAAAATTAAAAVTTVSAAARRLLVFTAVAATTATLVAVEFFDLAP